MSDINKIILVGRLGQDPVQRQTRNGKAVVNFSLATNRKKGEETEWHHVVVWGKQGESCAKYLKKGSSIYLEGTMKSKKYLGKQGESLTAREVHASFVNFLNRNGSKGSPIGDADNVTHHDSVG